MTTEHKPTSRLPDRQWCSVKWTDGGRYPVVTQLWLYDEDHHEHVPIYHEFGLTAAEAKELARNLNRVARETIERGI